MRRSILRLMLARAAVVLSVVVVGACGSGEKGAAGGAPGGPGGPGAMPPPAVGVITARTETIPMVVELPGRTSPYLIAEVRPQVTGILASRTFVEGTVVKAGAALYEIEPAVYKAAVESAKATQARTEANRDVARLKAQRYAELVTIDAVSKQANDDAQAALKQAEAEVASAKAAADRAAIDLAYTHVTAPISGRIGRSAVTAGALVTANQPTALATIQQLDPIYVDVTQSSAEILRLKRDLEAGRMKRSKDATLPVKLVLEDGTEYPLAGKLELSEASVDPGTGSVTLRAVFPNPRGDLLPGMYVRARLTQGIRDEVIVLPHAALNRDPRGNAMVMIVNADNKVEAKVVEAAQSLGETWIVTRGVVAGDRVIIDGLQKVRPGAVVQPQPVTAKPGGAQAAGAQPAAAQPATTK